MSGPSYGLLGSLSGREQFPLRGAAAIPYQAERPHLSIWDRLKMGAGTLLGVPDEQSGLLSGPDASAARDQGLLSAGLSLLANSGYQPVGARPTLTQAIGQAVQAGQGGAFGGIQTQDALRARQAGMAQQRARLAFQQKWLGADTTNRQTLQNMLREAVALGLDKESTRIATVLSAMGAETQPRNIDPNSREGIAAKVELAKQMGALKIPGYQLKQDINGEWIWIPEPTATTRGNVATGVTGQKPGAAAKPELTPAELRSAEQVVEGIKTMKAHYAKNPKAAQTPLLTAAAKGLSNLGFGVGAAASGLVGPVGQSAMSPEQQGFQRGAVQVRHHYVGILPHSRSAMGLLEDINKGIVPPAGTDSSTIANDFVPQWDFTLSQLEPLIAEAKTAGATRKGPKPASVSIDSLVTKPIDKGKPPQRIYNP